jgi:hypothetical protein
VSGEVRPWSELDQLERRRTMLEGLLRSVREDARRHMEGFAIFVFYDDRVRVIEAGRIHVPTLLAEIMGLAAGEAGKG